MTRTRQAGPHLLIVPIIAGVIGCISVCTAGERQLESQVSASPATTSFQILGEYNDRWDVGADAVMVYFEDCTTKIETQIKSWVAKGYEPWVMFNSSQDYTGAYVTGKYDGGKHRDEIQRAADGSDFEVFDEGAYLVPNPNWLRYQKDFVKRSINAGAKAIVAEEPEFFSTAGYSPTFKAAWKQEYGTTWVDPKTNDTSRWMARRLMTVLYQRHLSAIFKYANTCDPAVKCLVAAHSPFDYAINPMVFPHAKVAALPEMNGYVAQVWSDTARSGLTDPTRGGEDVEAVFYKAFLEYNYFWNLLRGTNQDLIFLQDPKSDSEGFPWPTYRRWYEETVIASTLFDVSSFEVMPWPDRFFVKQAPQEQQTSCLAVVQAMRDLRNYKSDYSTPYAMLVSDTMLWTNPELDDAITGNIGIGVSLLRHGVPIDVVPVERAGESGFLDPYRVIFMSYDAWLPQSKAQQDALVTWVKRGGILAFLGGSRYSDIKPSEQYGVWWSREQNAQPQDALFKQLGIELKGTQIRTGRNTLVSLDDSHPLVRQLGKRKVVPECESLYAYKVPSATAIYAAEDAGPAVAFEQKVDEGFLFFLGIPPDGLARSRFGSDLIRSTAKYLSHKAGIPYQEADRISITRGPYTIAYATQDNVTLNGPAIDVLDADLPLIESKVLASDEYALLYRVDVLPKQTSILYSSSIVDKLKRTENQMSFEAAGPLRTVGATTIYSPTAKPATVSARDAVTGRDLLVEFLWSPERRTLTIKYRHAPNRHLVNVEVKWENE